MYGNLVTLQAVLVFGVHDFCFVTIFQRILVIRGRLLYCPLSQNVVYLPTLLYRRH